MTLAVVLAHGYHTGLEPWVASHPSSMIRIFNKPMIVHVIEALYQTGFKKVLVFVQHLPEQLEKELQEGSRWGLKIDFQLVHAEEAPLKELKIISMMSGQSSILVASADHLPLWDKHSWIAQMQHCGSGWVMYHQGNCCNWGLIPNYLLKNLPSTCSIRQFWEDMTHQLIEVEVDGLLSCQSLKDVYRAQCFLLESSEESVRSWIKPITTAKVTHDGIWKEHGVLIHPQAIINSPCYIGKDVSINNGVVFGPFSIIESYCLLDSSSHVHHCIVESGTYIGESLHLENVFASHSLLMNFAIDAHIKIYDTFIMSKLSTLQFATRFFGYVEQILASIILLFLFPLCMIARWAYFMQKTDIVSPHGEEDPRYWKEIVWWKIPLHSVFSSLCSLVANLPALASGKVHFFGLKPRSRKELNELPEEWKKIYLKAQVGWMTMEQAFSRNLTIPDFLFVHEAYYAAHRQLLLDGKCLFRAFKRYLFQRENKEG